MPVWYRPDENGEAIEVFQGTVSQMGEVLDAAREEIAVYRLALNEIAHGSPKMNGPTPRDIAKQALRDGVKKRRN